MKQHIGLGLAFAVACALAACGGGGGSSNGGGGTIPPQVGLSSNAPSVVKWSYFTSFQQQNVDVELAATPKPGNVMVVVLWNNGQLDGSPNTFTPPAGWTQIDVNPNYYATYQAFTHVVALGDTNTYVFSLLAPVRETVWIAAEINNASTVSPTDKAANSYAEHTAVFTTPVLTPAQPNELALAFNMPITTLQLAWTDPPGWTVGTGAGPTYIWYGEGLAQLQTDTAPVSESASTSQAPVGAFAGLVLVNPR